MALRIPFKLEVNATSIFALAALGVGAYAYLNRKDILATVKELGDKVLSPVTTPIAEAIVDVQHDPVTVAGEVELPGGERVAIQAIIDAGGSISSDGVFQWQGNYYQITPPQRDGVYYTVPWYGVF